MKNENQDNKNPSKSKPAFWTLRRAIVAFVVGVFAAAFLYPLFVREIVAKFFGKFDAFYWEKYGQFGDSFGFVTAIFACAAFFLLLKTYKVQQEELRETREVMSRQKFETTFFNILNLYSKSVDDFYGHASMHHYVGKREIEGYAENFLDFFHHLATCSIHGLVSDSNPNSNYIDRENIEAFSKYGDFMALHRHYCIFRTLSDLCDKNLSSAEEKCAYVEIAFSILSYEEIVFFSSYCLLENHKSEKDFFANYFSRNDLRKSAVRSETEASDITKWLAGQFIKQDAPKI